MTDLVIHAGTKFALHQWLQARGLGQNVQDTDATSPTFGDWFYTHTDPASTFIYWRHPSGKLEATFTAGDPPVTTFFAGFYGIIRFLDGISIEGWVRNSTAVSILDSFPGVGGEGVTVVTPEKVNEHCDTIGVPRHEILGGMDWSDPRVWWASNVMIGDLREIDGISYASLIDFNVWSPLSAPQLWTVQEPEPPAISAWVQPTGGHDAYPLGARVTHNGQTWENTGSAANVWAPGVFGWVVV